MLTKIFGGGQTGADRDAPEDCVKFREIPRLDGYLFGDDGSVWSRWIPGHKGKKGAWHRVFGHKTSYGYLCVDIKICTRKISCRIHRLILEAFVGPCPEGMEARHLDNDPTNNRLDNLCWGTPKENTEDRRRHGTMAIGERIGCAKLTAKDIGRIYDLYEEGHMIKEIGDIFSIDHSSTSKILRGLYWSHAVPGRIPPLLGKDARQRGAILREQRKRY